MPSEGGDYQPFPKDEADLCLLNPKNFTQSWDFPTSPHRFLLLFTQQQQVPKSPKSPARMRLPSEVRVTRRMLVAWAGRMDGGRVVVVVVRWIFVVVRFEGFLFSSSFWFAFLGEIWGFFYVI